MADLLKVNIRKAKKEDMKYVFDMIKDLAAFEKMSDQVKVNVKTLEQDGFGPNPTFHCFVAEHRENIIGYALYYFCYSTWLGTSIFLEDLFVKEDYRKHGVGKALFKEVARLAKDSSGRLDLHSLRWNPAVEFYKRFGAIDLTQIEEWHLLRMNADALDKLLL